MSPNDDDQSPEGLAGLPPALRGDPRRQAVPSIHGTVYQAWWSIDAWLRLKDADEVIYLEGAEDFDVIRSSEAIAVQVKRNTGSISLGNRKAHFALESFWLLAAREPNRKVDFHYLTTSAVAAERTHAFNGLTGMDAWRAARTNNELAADIAAYLVHQLEQSSALRAFLCSAETREVQERLFRRFYWLTNQPDLDTVKRSVDDRIAVLLHDQRRPISLGPTVRKHLESRFWELVLEPAIERRVLTRGELLRQVEWATTTYLPLPVHQIADLIGNAPPGLHLLNLLIQKVPRPPEPLLRRTSLVSDLERLVRQRQAILISGTVYKGKSTLAQLVASALCPQAWWINLTERGRDQVDNIFLALSSRVETGDCPNVLVIDDLDISAAAHRVYCDSLALLLQRTRVSGHALILTAQGNSSSAVGIEHLGNVTLLEVPEVTADEAEALCVEHGCPSPLAKFWGTFINAWTRGHPKLVQIRLAQLVSRGWPNPSSDDFISQSSELVSARQLARQLLSESVEPVVAEFVYLISEASIPLHRSVAMRLGDAVAGLHNTGDVIDGLSGKWLETLDRDWMRTTALLQNTAPEVWSDEKRKWAHVCLYDAILEKNSLDPAEAAALLFHAYVAGQRHRIALTAMRLQLIKNKEAKRAVDQNLLWLPFVALNAGQSMVDEAMAASALRSLQFRVASTLDVECLADICERWAEDVERIERPEAKLVNLAMMWLAIGLSQSQKVPLIPRLRAAAGVRTLTGELALMKQDMARGIAGADADMGIPEGATPAQLVLLCAIRVVRSSTALAILVDWLETQAGDVRAEFEEMLGWPAVQTAGAFVQGAWAGQHENTTNWEAWLDLLDHVHTYATQHHSHGFGREAAKAKAIILTEYFDNGAAALAVLDRAEDTFGASHVLLEQRANTLFQAKDDTTVLEIWEKLIAQNAGRELDPFAYRRAAISAARLQEWARAAQLFYAGAEAAPVNGFELTRFGLLVDSTLALAMAGQHTTAANRLARAALALPASAAAEGDARWEAVQRAAVEVRRTIEQQVWHPQNQPSVLQPGFASSPALEVPKTEPNQLFRSELTRIQSFQLGATVGNEFDGLSTATDTLSASKHLFVRWSAAETRLALFFANGAPFGFIAALIDFDRLTTQLQLKRDTLSALEPDESVCTVPLAPDRWFGLLAAGLACCGPNVIANLEVWHQESTTSLGANTRLSQMIEDALRSANLPDQALSSALRDTTASVAMRCAAAAQLLLAAPEAAMTLRLQAFLASAIVSDASVARQDLCNRHVARVFGKAWHSHLKHPFQFHVPRRTTPVLVDALEGLENGNATLATLLRAASGCTGTPLGEFMERLH
jgi:uncharacterized protein (UPF0248 family)